jgi:enediyne biosynthesis protein E4
MAQPRPLLIAIALLLLGGCEERRHPAQMVVAAHELPTDLRLELRRTFPIPTECENHFVTHTLQHVTRTSTAAIGYYDSNGAGIAAEDLDGDGLLELVIANLAGKNTVAWNLGGMQFREQTLPFGASRAVAVVDLDGDGGRDLVFTQNLGAVLAYRDLGGETADVARYRAGGLPGVRTPAFAMDWADATGDGRLDLATASYDTHLEKELRDSFLFGPGAGVMLYTRDERGGFVGERLATQSQSLAISFFDVDGDGALDLIVGNDFELPDYIFANPSGAGPWRRIAPFPITTRNTMGFEVADVNRDGRLDLFATDMKPDLADVRNIAAWLPLMERSYRFRRIGERQIEENVLLIAQAHGNDLRYRNQAYALGIDSSGWSWSGRFGDLNLNGYLDLYIVNGMIAHEAFPHLANGELIEANTAFAADARGFLPAPTWGLGSLTSGRGMVIADLDGDGDLDIAVNVLAGPSLVFENRLCRQGDPLMIELRWPESGNLYAIGAQLTLHSDTGILMRALRATGGYLSGSPTPQHFGIPHGTDPGRLHIRWPDGRNDWLLAPEPGHQWRITRQPEGP